MPRASRRWTRSSTSPSTASSAPPSRASPSVQEIWKRMEQNGDIYIDTYAGWYSVRDEAYYAEDETDRRRGRRAPRPAGHAGRVGRGEELFLPPLRLSGQAARALREPARFHRPGLAPQRGDQLRQGRPEGSLDLAHHLRLGRQGAERPRARDVCLGRRADQLHHRRRLSRRDRSELALLAGRRAHHRQGHHPLPRGVLAGLPDVGRHSRAEARLCPRLPVQQGREDVEVGRQRRRPLQPRRAVWRRPDALFLPARGAVRAGRQLQPRGHRRAHQCRSRQRSRQSRAALAVDDRKATRRRAAGARRIHRQRQGDPGAGRRHDRSCRAPRWRRSRSINGSTPCGPWSPKPTAISRARRRGRWPRPIRRGRRRCSTSPPKWCARSRSWRSR